MKISDEERREVAAKLRALEPWAHFEVGEPITREEFEEALGLEYVIGDSYDAVGIRRLADLIDCPTCKNLATKPADELLCSECGEHVDIAHMESTDDYHARYCPKCGREIDNG